MHRRRGEEPGEPGQGARTAAGGLQAEPGAEPPADPPFGQLLQPRLGNAVKSQRLAALEPQAAQLPDVPAVLGVPAAGRRRGPRPGGGRRSAGPAGWSPSGPGGRSAAAMSARSGRAARSPGWSARNRTTCMTTMGWTSWWPARRGGTAARTGSPASAARAGRPGRCARCGERHRSRQSRGRTPRRRGGRWPSRCCRGRGRTAMPPAATARRPRRHSACPAGVLGHGQVRPATAAAPGGPRARAAEHGGRTARSRATP